MGLPSPKTSLILVAVVFALSCFGFTLFVWKSFGGPSPLAAHGYRFHVLFGSEASQLAPNADVRISGVNVGKVIEVERRGLAADALLEMERPYAPIPRNTRAILRYKTLLGETFVELTTGDRDAPKLREGGTLPPEQVADVQQVDAVLGSFDAPTRAAFKKFLQDTARALDDRGDDINAAIGHGAPAVEHLADVVEIMDRQRASLRTLVRESGVALRAMAERESDLRSLVEAGREVFSATAERNRELTRVVRALPGFLADTRDGLREIDAASADAAPTLEALRPAIPLIRPALDETMKLAPALEGTFEDLGPAITAGRSGLPALSRVLDAARPALGALYAAGRDLVPVVEYLGLHKVDVQASLAKVAAATNYRIPRADGSGQQVLRNVIPINDETIVAAGERLAANRHNPYMAPGGLTKLYQGGLEAFDCRNTANPQPIPIVGDGTPECRLQAPRQFRGLTGQFPRVERDGP